jgi:uncharacterized integral membrane protein (TIGR00698 family)
MSARSDALSRLGTDAPGLALAFCVAAAAWGVDQATPIPTMLAALGLGLALQPVVPARCAPGIERAAREVLRVGVLLLGARVTLADIADLGAPIAAMTVGALVASFALGVGLARGLGLSDARAVLSAGAVSICGASATLALAAALPREDDPEKDAIPVVASISIIGTVGMVAYPWAARHLGLPDQAIGVYVGATLHEVAQVVGAGYAVSESAAATAATVKLLRVACLAPMVMAVSLRFRTARPDGARPPLLPWFLVGFLTLAAAGSAGLLPQPTATLLGDASKWALAAALAAIGLKTSPRKLADAGPVLLGAIVAQTAVLAALVAAAMALWPALRAG